MDREKKPRCKQLPIHKNLQQENQTVNLQKTISLPFVLHRQHSEDRSNLSPANPGSCIPHRRRPVL